MNKRNPTRENGSLILLILNTCSFLNLYIYIDLRTLPVIHFRIFVTDEDITDEEAMRELLKKETDAAIFKGLGLNFGKVVKLKSLKASTYSHQQKLERQSHLWQTWHHLMLKQKAFTLPSKLSKVLFLN